MKIRIRYEVKSYTVGVVVDQTIQNSSLESQRGFSCFRVFLR